MLRNSNVTKQHTYQPFPPFISASYQYWSNIMKNKVQSLFKMCSSRCTPVREINHRDQMNNLHMPRQLAEQGRSPMCQRIQCVYFYSKVNIHHTAAWFPDQLKVSQRWFFFKEINHECLLHMTCWFQVSPFITQWGRLPLCAVKYLHLIPVNS